LKSEELRFERDSGRDALYLVSHEFLTTMNKLLEYEPHSGESMVENE